METRFVLIFYMSIIMHCPSSRGFIISTIQLYNEPPLKPFPGVPSGLSIISRIFYWSLFFSLYFPDKNIVHKTRAYKLIFLTT